MKQRTWNIVRFFVLPALVAGLYVVTTLPRITTYGLNNDELIYIRRTQLYETFITGDFRNPIWQSWDAYDQPPLAPYIYGLALSDYGNQYGGYTNLLRAANLTGQYYPCASVPFDPSKPTDHYDYWRCLDGTAPQTFPQELKLAQTLLYRTRLAATLVTAGTLAMITLIGTMTVSPIVGVLAAGFLGWFSLFGQLGVMGMIDPLLYGFYAALLLMTVAPGKWPLVRYSIAGLIAGLAVSTKFNAGSIVIAYVLVRAVTAAVRAAG